VDDIAARAVFLPVESIRPLSSPRDSRPAKRSSESVFDSGGMSYTDLYRLAFLCVGKRTDASEHAATVSGGDRGVTCSSNRGSGLAT
jgi:hypothetical protein